MNFREFLNTVKYEINYLEGEINYETILDAWRAGASEMLKRLIGAGWIDKDLESLIKFAPPFQELLEGKE